MNGKVCILGSFNVDIVAKVARFPKGGESIMAQGSALGPGGKGANQAMAASLAGSQVYSVTKVGTDQFSQFAYDHLSSSDIHAFKLYQSDTEPTGNTIIYVSQQNGENMIAIYPGANQLNIIKLAHALGKKVILNPAPYGVDTTGAGDAFNGASAFASLAVEREGSSNMLEYQQVIARLSQR